MAEFAHIIGQAWEDKKKMANGITNPTIQKAFDVAFAAGATAARGDPAAGVRGQKVQDIMSSLPMRIW